VNVLVQTSKFKEGVLPINAVNDSELILKIYLFSDVHFDSVMCNRKALEKHLNKAKEEDALIVLGGDWFDAMQGRFDPRSSLDELRPEYRRQDYFDYVVQDSAEFLSPYATNIILVAQGNHETEVKKRNNIDLMNRLTMLLNLKGANAVTGEWTGWIVFFLKAYNRNASVKLYYSHNGGGGNSKVTRGVIETNRQAVYLPDANVVWNGHNHQGYIVPIARERISMKCRPFKDICWFVRSPGYKEEWENRTSFGTQKGFGPTPTGCVKLTIKLGSVNFPQIIPELVIDN